MSRRICVRCRPFFQTKVLFKVPSYLRESHACNQSSGRCGKVLWKQTMTFTCWVWHALPTGRPSIVHHSEWTLCTPLAGCGAWFSVFCPSFQLWTEAGNLGPTHCYAAMLSGWQWHNAPRCSLGSLGDGPSSWVAIVGYVRTGQAGTHKTHCVEGRPLWTSLHTIILFFGFVACDFPVASEKLGKCEWDSFRTYLNVFGQNLICIEWGWHFAYHLLKKLLQRVLNLCHDEWHVF